MSCLKVALGHGSKWTSILVHPSCFGVLGYQGFVMFCPIIRVDDAPEIPPGEDESKIHRRGWRRAQGWKDRRTHQKSSEIMIAMQPIQDGWEGHSYR